MTFAHVCRRWRSLVFQSPRSLNLRLVCMAQTPARDGLDIWPPLPIIISNGRGILDDGRQGVDNIIAALEHNDRVCKIQLYLLSRSQFGYVKDSEAMQKPFPELTDLQLGKMWEYEEDEPPPPIPPDSFLGGSAPRLESLHLSNIPFPGLLKLLLSTARLRYLALYNIPRSGYIPPEAMAACLSALTNLEFLRLHFEDPRPPPSLETRPPPPLPLHAPSSPVSPKLDSKVPANIWR